jgi:hypothetical protein
MWLISPRSLISPCFHSLFPNLLALWDAPAFATALVILAAGLSVLLVLGFYDRAAAIALWYLGACWHGRMPLIANPSLPYAGWLLLAHACLPAAPFGLSRALCLAPCCRPALTLSGNDSPS